MKLEFVNVQDLLTVRKDIMPIAERNRRKLTALDTYAEVARLVTGHFEKGGC
jgi:DNA polymerase epsilon subunit 1